MSALGEEKKTPKEEKKKSDLMRLWETTAFSVSAKKLLAFHEKYPAALKLASVIDVILAVLLAAVANRLIGKSVVGFIIWFMIMFAAAAILTIRIGAMLFKGTTHDADFNLDRSESGVAGTSKKMDEEEQKETFHRGNYKEILGDILGSDTENEEILYSLIRNYKTRMNGNKLVFGTPGSGKSRCLVIPILFQIARRGESAIITDSKGAIYKKTAEMFRARGYKIKVINFIPGQLAHSDGLNYLSTINKKDRIGAFALAQTIINNTEDGKGDPFFSKAELNLLCACILYELNREDQKNPSLGSVYDFLTTHSTKEIETILEALPDTHPAKGPFNIFKDSGDSVKNDFKGGLSIRLQVFNDPLVKKITGTDNTSFSAPGKEKCVYYVIINDQSKEMSFLIALFFTCLFNELVKYADGQGGDKEELPVKVNMILDEFYSCGIIPDFEQKLSNVRSRGIDTMIILQSLGQLETMYPDKLYESIIDCCSLQICLGANSNETAKHFSDRSGIMTAKAKSERVIEGAGDMLHLHAARQLTLTDTARPVYTVDEVQTLPSDRLLVAPSSRHVIELKRVDLLSHPMRKEVRPADPRTHIPDWLESTTKAEREKLELNPDEKYVVEGNWDIELCTDEDFEEPWNSEKEAVLCQKIKEELKRRMAAGPDEKLQKRKSREAKKIIEKKIDEVRDMIENASYQDLIADEVTAALACCLDDLILQLRHESPVGEKEPKVSTDKSEEYTPSTEQTHFRDLFLPQAKM